MISNPWWWVPVLGTLFVAVSVLWVFASAYRTMRDGERELLRGIQHRIDMDAVFQRQRDEATQALIRSFIRQQEAINAEFKRTGSTSRSGDVLRRHASRSRASGTTRRDWSSNRVERLAGRARQG